MIFFFINRLDISSSVFLYRNFPMDFGIDFFIYYCLARHHFFYRKFFTLISLAILHFSDKKIPYCMFSRYRNFSV